MAVDSQLAEKGLDTKVLERNRLQAIAEKYRLQGFEVVTEPSKSLIPFDLGNYCPDLIARKGLDEGYIKSCVMRSLIFFRKLNSDII